jgi:hypothetical protein
MDAVRCAAPLARLLIAIGEAKRSGEVWLEQRGRVVRLSLRAGQLLAISGVPLEPLGDLLRELDALDSVRARALGDRGSDVPIGVRLIAAGATSWSAVQKALVLQRARAVALLLRLPVTRVMRDRRAEVTGSVGIDLSTVVWDAMLSLAARTHIGPAFLGQPLALTAKGERHAIDLRALSHDEPLRTVVCALGLAKPVGRREDAYALLLRKRRELARNAGPRALLDLPIDADARGAQRALRKLAIKLHPDRFQSDDVRIQHVSNEVISALTRAASSFVA